MANYPLDRSHDTVPLRAKLRIILGIGMIALAMVVAVPVAVNFPASWPGAVLAVAIAGLGISFVAGHLKLHHRRRHDRRHGKHAP